MVSLALKDVCCTSLKMSISASCRSATDVITVFGLFLGSLFRYETTPTTLVQLENLVTQSIRLRNLLL